jgi:hypothetical protein
MKKIFLLFVFGITVCLYARDFQSSWVEEMSTYIGKSIDTIQYNFTPIDNGYAYTSTSKAGGFLGIGSREVGTFIYANNKKIVEYTLWYMDSWLGGDEKREISDIKDKLTALYGTPKSSNNGWSWTTKKEGIFGKVYEIGIYRASSDNSACVLIQRQKGGFEKRWENLLRAFGVIK